MLTRLAHARKRFMMWLVVDPWLGLLWLSARIYPEGGEHSISHFVGLETLVFLRCSQESRSVIAAARLGDGD